MTSANARVLAGLPGIREWLEALYRHLHAHPELSMAEHKTAERVVEEVRAMPGGGDAEIVTGIAMTGLGVVVRNGDGPTVMIRADMDGLPVLEETGLPYASVAQAHDEDGNTVPVMHACGHDSHIACVLGALRLMLESRDEWRGTLVVVFQPAEEAHSGAEAMVTDGLTERLPKPEVAFGQHLFPGPAGTVQVSAGPVMASCHDFRITLRGKGGHGSAPHLAIDPVVMAASLVMRLQGVVSRQVPPRSTAVLSIGRISAGVTTNVIPASAEMEGTLRTYDNEIADFCLALLKRAVIAEADSWGAPAPIVEVFDHLPVTNNDPCVTAEVRAAFVAELGEENVRPFEPMMGSEDFSTLADAWGAPYCFWSLGAFDPDEWTAAEAAGTQHEDFPDNHSPLFAPVLQPMLDTGVRAMVTAAMSRLAVDAIRLEGPCPSTLGE